MRLSKYPLVRQYDRADCGPASLLTILKFYGGSSSLRHIRELCRTDPNGCSMLDMVKASRALGFNAYGAKGEYEDLMKEKMPCIAHIVNSEGLNHFLVIYKISKKGVLAADPGQGKYKLSREEFCRLWASRSVILLKPDGPLLRQNPPGWTDWLRPYILREQTWIVQSVFLGALYTSLGLATALFMQKMIDSFIPSHRSGPVVITVFVLLTFLLLRASVGYFRQKFLIELSRRIATGINSDAINHIFHLPKIFFDSRKTGDITARMNDASKIQEAVILATGGVMIDLLIVFASALMLFLFSVPHGLMALAFIPLYAFFIIVNSRDIKLKQNEAMKLYSSVQSEYFDSFSGIDEIIGFNSGEWFSSINRLLFEGFQEKLKQLGLRQTKLLFIEEFLGAVMISAFLLSSSLMVIGNSLRLGEMVAVYSLFAGMLPSVHRIVDSVITIQAASVASQRLLDLLAEEKEISCSKELILSSCPIFLDDSAFTWPNGKTLFSAVSMKIPPGHITALTGPSGSGKSTLANILTAKYGLTSGRLTAGGTPITPENRIAYRKMTSSLPQDMKIFNGTVLENILMGRCETNIENVNRRLEELGLLRLFERFPDGLFTMTGEDSRRLSGGEKQLISLARAMYSRPRLIVIDEGLSGTDAALQCSILDLLFAYAEKNAVLMITHDLDIIKKCGFVYILSEGSIVQSGRPAALLARDGPFRSMWTAAGKEEYHADFVT